jgi:hypothetical protein
MQIVDIIRPKLVGFKMIDAPICDALYNKLVELMKLLPNNITHIKECSVRYNNEVYNFDFHIKRQYYKKHLSEKLKIVGIITKGNPPPYVRGNSIYFELTKNNENKIEALFIYGAIKYYRNIAYQLLKLALMELV